MESRPWIPFPPPSSSISERQDESDATSSSGRSSPSDTGSHQAGPNTAGSLFLDATIAQDDTRGTSADTHQLLAGKGPELARKGRVSRPLVMPSRHRNYAPGKPPPPPYIGTMAPHHPQIGPGMGHRPPPGPPTTYMAGQMPHGPSSRPGIHRPFLGGPWMQEKVDLNSPWRRSLARHRSTARAANSRGGSANDALPQPNEASKTKEGVQEQPGSPTMQHLSASGHTGRPLGAPGIGMGNDDVAAMIGEGQAANLKGESPGLDGGFLSSSANWGESPADPGLAAALGRISDRYLKLDVLDHSQDVSRYVGYLLDTIHSLESKLSYANARDLPSESESGSESEKEPPDEKEIEPRFQVLHKVVCSISWHEHNNATYEDEPRFEESTDPDEEKGLCATVRVPDLRYYVQRHPDIAFVVIKEHECGQPIKVRKDDTQAVSERKENILVPSGELDKAIKSIAEYEPYRSSPMGSRAPLGLMEAPYIFLFHHYQKLKDLAVVVFRRNDKTLRAGVLRQVPVKAAEDKKKTTLAGWSWSYDGLEARRKAWIEDAGVVPAGEFPINALPIYPLKYAKPEDVRKLREIGNGFWSMRGQGLRCYTGWDERHDRYYSNDRFMVDVATFNVMYSNKSDRPDKVESTYDKWPQRLDATKELPQDCELLLPSFIEGFHLGSKKWVVLNVSGFLPQVDWNKNAFRQLVLDEKTKEMIYALVDVQKSRDKAMDDIIKGKGNGLILLLHGSPGTGKTLTAESVAEIAEKPLYRVTCGDIGTDAKGVEEYLQTVLYLGKIWDCVLLLDEADVFLEERTMADLARNSLVSVFLRILEYHEGILILTSNRVGTFDEAFKSRIQVAIHYDNLTKKSRKAIWRNFFDMIEESEEDANMPELERRLDELAAEEMNGRQIRNALLTARQLAKHRNEMLDWEHLNQVIKTSAAFNKYLKTVKGHTDDRWAREEGIR
ncbi:AAA family ATPAse [Apiospora rasikravindrae]|uniref:AAA family ATPAse n=1 Tax=Apiospora rasikravindrae TaxID=990691 RepID=A0ABR1RXC4_9PEZI